MAVAQATLNVDQGATFRTTVMLQDGSGNAIDLTDASAQMQVRVAPGAASPIFLDISDTASAAGLLALGGAAGSIAIYIAADWTAQFPTHRPAVFSIVVTFPNGDIVPVLKGTVVTDAAITFADTTDGSIEA